MSKELIIPPLFSLGENMTDYFELIEKLGDKEEITDFETLTVIFDHIDFLYMFTEIPHIFKSKKTDIPSVLIYQGRVWKLRDANKAIKDLGMSEIQ